MRFDSFELRSNLVVQHSNSAIQALNFDLDIRLVIALLNDLRHYHIEFLKPLPDNSLLVSYPLKVHLVFLRIFYIILKHRSYFLSHVSFYVELF